MDRFIMKITIGYPGDNDELEIIRKGRERDARFLESVVTPEDILELRDRAEKVTCSEAVERYILAITKATRTNEGIRLGVSPRGSIAMMRAAKSRALISGRDYVLPDDIKFLAPYVFGHRLILSPQGKTKWGNGFNAINNIVDSMEVPV